MDEGFLVVAQMGKVADKADSMIGFYEDGELLGKFTTPLADITGLAYGVKKKPARLFAIDVNWNDTDKGGLFKIVADKENPQSNCLAQKMIPLDKPTAMAFDKAGNLYITLIGTSLPGIEGPSGRLIKIKSAETKKTLEAIAAEKAEKMKAEKEAKEKEEAGEKEADKDDEEQSKEDSKDEDKDKKKDSK